MPDPTPLSLTGTQTVLHDVAPHLTAAHLTALLATPVEQLTVAQLVQLIDATSRVEGGSDPAALIGALLP